MKTFFRVAFEFTKSVIAAECMSFAAAGLVLVICAIAGVSTPVALGIAGFVKAVAWVAAFIMS
jgi:hypothetical protein